MADVKPRVLVMTAGHLSTCPRMLKAADALAERYDVRVVSTRHMAWASEADEHVRRTRRWRWSIVDYDRASTRGTYWWSGARFQSASRLARAVGPARVPLPFAVRAYSRVHAELVRAALAEPFDFVYGGTTGALAAVAETARRARVRFALDLEDFHSGEHGGRDGWLANVLAERIERSVLPGAAFLTTSSDAIADAYERKYGRRPAIVHNTFPLPAVVPETAPTEPGALRLYWFSQTIGAGRGLEQVVQAAGVAGLRGDLALRGRPAPGFLESLIAFAREVAPTLRIAHHPPADPDAMVDLCRTSDVGLSLEQTDVENRALCLTNKALTYPLAGLAVALTDTPGQRPFGRALGEGAWLSGPGDVPALAAGLRRWAEHPSALAAAKAAAWRAARTRWHWEHAEERGALLDAFAGAVV